MRKPVLYAAIFLVSMVTLMFEIAITRIFSVLLWYHFVFFIISIVLFGFGIGGLIVGWLAKKKHPVADWDNFLMKAAVTYGCSIPLSVLMLLYFPSPNIWGAYMLIALIPFIAGGIFSSAVFHRYSESSGVLYFADLSGAALGSLGVVGLLSILSPIDLVFFLGGLCALVGWGFAWVGLKSKRGWILAAITASLMVLGGINHQVRLFDLDYRHDFLLGKTVNTFLRDHGKLTATQWDAFSRVDAVQQNNHPESIWLFTDGGAGSEMIRYNGDPKPVEFLKNDVGFQPFTWGKKDNVLIIGPGGGKDVLMALLAGSSRIDAVEINRALVRMVDDAKDFNGGIYQRPGVNLYVEDGRSFVERQRQTYDLIYLPLVYTQASEAGGYALAENYVFTKEAFNSYLKHLSHAGQIILKMHTGDDSARAVLTAISVLRDHGLSQQAAFQRILVYGRQVGAAIQTPTIILTKNPINQAFAQRVMDRLAAVGLQPVFIPHIYEKGLFGAFAEGDPASIHQFIDETPVAVTPTTDDQPFFYNAELGLPNNLMVLILLVIPCVIVFSWIVFRWREQPKKKQTFLIPFGGYFSYFALIGAAFMFIETVLIQKYILLLGHPIYAVSVVLFSLLIAGGLGSYSVSRMQGEKLRLILRLAGLAIGVLAILNGLLIPALFRSMIGLPLIARISWTFLTILPLGFLMGIPFPLGLRMARTERPNDIALMWAANGAFSVLGSVICVAVSMLGGYNAALWFGSFCYGALTLMMLKLKPEDLPL